MNTRGAYGFSKYNALKHASPRAPFEPGTGLHGQLHWVTQIDNLTGSTSAKRRKPRTWGCWIRFNLHGQGACDFDARHPNRNQRRLEPTHLPRVRMAREAGIGRLGTAPIITARTGNSFTTFDCSAQHGDTVCARYFVPSGATISFERNSNNAGKLGRTCIRTSACQSSQTYFQPWLLNATGGVDPASASPSRCCDGDAICNITTTRPHPISTGAKLQGPRI